jgi:hypothetical protein
MWVCASKEVCIELLIETNKDSNGISDFAEFIIETKKNLLMEFGPPLPDRTKGHTAAEN